MTQDRRRGRLIAAIHAEAKRRGISDEDRRELQRNATGVESCADMTPAQLGRVLTLVTGRGRRLRDVSRPQDDLPGMRRRALALAADFGAGERYVDAIARRQWGRPLQDCDAEQLRGVIAACYTARRRRARAAE